MTNEYIKEKIKKHLTLYKASWDSYGVLIKKMEQFFKDNGCAVEVESDPESCGLLCVTGPNNEVRKARNLLGDVDGFLYYSGNDYEEWNKTEYGE